MHKNIRNTIPADGSLGDVLRTLNSGIYGVVFVTDGQERVIGLFTDGDVRRAMLAGGTLASPAADYMTRQFTSARTGLSRDKYIAMLTDKIRHLPVLDEQGRLADCISLAELWQVPVMEPSLGGNELKYVTDCITSNWISSQGAYVRRFEEEFSTKLGTGLSLATSSGTTALHLALTALEIGPGDEVIVPDATFAATANVVIHCGAKPIFADVSPGHWTLDPERFREAITERTKAVIPVHLYGHPCDMDPILEIAREYGLFVVEDCAEALGAQYKGKPVGTMGDVGCFSFFSNKIITTGEGGMVITDNAELGERMKVLRDHGMAPGKRYVHLYAGFNYRMTNLQAAIGLAQLEQFDTFMERRQAIADCYGKHLAGIDGLTLPPDMEWADTICWIYTVLAKDYSAEQRDSLMEDLNSQGIETRPFFPPMHTQPAYGKVEGEFPVSSRLAAQGFSLPSGYTMSTSQVRFICRCLAKALKAQH